jgi:hypothetical protein
MIDLGEVVQIAREIRNADGILTNPATAVLTITLPDGTITAPTVTLPPAETGILRVDYTTVQAGLHHWRLTTTVPTTAAPGVFDVRGAAPPFVVSLEDAKKHLNIPAATTTDDEELRGFIESTTWVIESDPDFGVGPVVARTFVDRIRTQNSSALVLTRRPVLAVTSIVAARTGGTGYDIAGLDIDAAAGLVYRGDGSSFTGGPWNVSYVAGRRQITANITHAARIIIQHLWSTQRTRDARRPSPTSAGDLVETRTQSGVAFTIPRKAVELLRADIQAGGFA